MPRNAPELSRCRSEQGSHRAVQGDGALHSTHRPFARRSAYLWRRAASRQVRHSAAPFGRLAAAGAVAPRAPLGIAPPVGVPMRLRVALRPRPGVTGAVAGETPFGAGPALGTLRECRRPAALDAEADGLAFGMLSAAALAVGTPLSMEKGAPAQTAWRDGGAARNGWQAGDRRKEDRAVTRVLGRCSASWRRDCQLSGG